MAKKPAEAAKDVLIKNKDVIHKAFIARMDGQFIDNPDHYRLFLETLLPAPKPEDYEDKAEDSDSKE